MQARPRPLLGLAGLHALGVSALQRAPRLGATSVRKLAAPPLAPAQQLAQDTAGEPPRTVPSRSWPRAPPLVRWVALGK